MEEKRRHIISLRVRRLYQLSVTYMPRPVCVGGSYIGLQVHVGLSSMQWKKLSLGLNNIVKGHMLSPEVRNMQTCDLIKSYQTHKAMQITTRPSLSH